MTETRRDRVSFHLAWLLPAVAAAVVYSTWSVTRHRRFGSGAWDLGNHTQALWLLAHGKGFISSVLGDVNFMGDHFMPSLVLLAPLAWTGSSEILLYAQALLIAAAAWPLALLCRRRHLTPFATGAIVCAYLFGVGTQSAANFDFHLVALLPLTLLLAVWAFEDGRRPLAYACLVIAAGCRESAILYAGAVGVWLALVDRRRRLEGVAIASAALAVFLAVVAWIQPHLLAGAPPTMLPAARYASFGSTFGDIAISALRHPVRAAQTFVTPATKLATLGLTLGGVAFLPVLAPDALLLSAPNFVERFLADKPEAWGTGYHYSLVPTALVAFAAAVAMARLRRFETAAAALVVVSTVAASIAAYPVGVELASLEKPYFASPDQAAVNRRALAAVPASAAVVAQNHFLPHLALREHIWLPEERFLRDADYVVLDVTQDPWPHDGEHIARLVDRIHRDPAFLVVFNERSTIVFSRQAKP